MGDMQTPKPVEQKRAEPKRTPPPSNGAGAQQGNREPIPIRLLCFNANRAAQALPLGIRQSTSIKARTDDRRGYEIVWMPWLRAFHVTAHPDRGDKNGTVRAGYIPEHQVTYWETCDAPGGESD